MYHSNVSGRSDLRALLIASFIGRVSFVNNGWRELKETPSSNWKIPCQAFMFADYAIKFSTKCEATHRHTSIKVAVAGERAQFSFDVVFSAVVSLRRSFVRVCVQACLWMGSTENGMWWYVAG
ncbi:hypothetical protein T01_15211 [Trichinella spiralis]|uniref:Uncharacterized protein n=1 Tax=Trichinella spiralis TaxID=6334 RepID=A0A0V1AL50_TRISP|nr:hypothetical protein T01_15211 [Trichinella spiralis]